jgi:hypothetical protein
MKGSKGELWNSVSRRWSQFWDGCRKVIEGEIGDEEAFGVRTAVEVASGKGRDTDWRQLP